jgi:hypothetical protein
VEETLSSIQNTRIIIFSILNFVTHIKLNQNINSFKSELNFFLLFKRYVEETYNAQPFSQLVLFSYNFLIILNLWKLLPGADIALLTPINTLFN